MPLDLKMMPEIAAPAELQELRPPPMADEEHEERHYSPYTPPAHVMHEKPTTPPTPITYEGTIRLY
jgi:hypothetical protein